MSRPLRLLLVEGSEDAAARLLRELRRSGFEPVCERVETAAAMSLALRRQTWDVIIANHHLPQFSAQAALALARQNGRQVPFIVVSGTAGEEAAVSAMKQGATDYLLENCLPRLGAAVEQALDRQRLREGERQPAPAALHSGPSLQPQPGEQALQESFTLLKAVMEGTPDVIFVKDLESRYLMINSAGARLLGHPLHDIIGQDDAAFFPPDRARILREEDRQVIELEKTHSFENLFDTPAGTRTYLSIKSPSRDRQGKVVGLIGISRDITERYQAEKALRDSEALYQSLVENLPLAVFRKDVAGRITFANQMFCDMVRTPPGAILGKTSADFYPPDVARREAQEDLRVVRTGKVFEEVKSYQDPQRDKIFLQVVKTAVYDSKGQLVGTQGLFWDVTERVRMEAELERTLDDLRVARQIQQKLFPKTPPRLPGVDVGGASYPAEATGGDYFDYIPMAGGMVGIVVGDVSGHGIGPALLMASTRAYLRGLVQTHQDPGEILTLTNRVLAADTIEDRFVTLLFARFDPRSRSLVYASAGHTTGYILDRLGKVRRRLKSTAPPLAILPDCPFPASGLIPLGPGEMVLFLTDGVMEAQAPDSTVFGIDRALHIVRVYWSDPARRIVENLYHAVRAFSQNTPALDDITMVVIKVDADP